MRIARGGLVTCVALGLVPGGAAASFHQLPGSPNFDQAKQATRVQIANYQGKPFVVWVEAPASGIGTQLHAARFDGTSWVAAGGVLNVDPTRTAAQPSLTMVDGVPHVAFQEYDATPQSHIYVKSFDGTNWSAPIGGAPLDIDTTKGASQPNIASIGNGLAIHSQHPVVAWVEWTGTPGAFLIHVKKWDGSSWTSVGTSPSTPGIQSNAPSLAQTTSGFVGSTPYLAWTELSGPGAVEVVRIATFNGSAWTSPVNINVNANRSAGAPALATVSNRVHVAFIETDGTHFQLHVKAFDGQNFTALGGSLNVDATKDASGPSIADIAGVPYVAWTEGFGSSGHTYVKRFDGSNWLLVGTVGAPTAYNSQLANVGGFPAVGWQESLLVHAALEVPPVCTDSSASVPPATPAAVSLSCNEGTRSVVSGPANGTLSALDPAGGGATYTPSASFAGADSFSFKASDGMFDSNVATASLNVAAASGGGGAGGGGGGGGGGGTIATLSKLRESHPTFVVGKGSTPTTGTAAAKPRSHPKGTTFSFTLDQSATVKVALSRRLTGRRVAGRCRPATRKLRLKPKCPRLQAVGTLTRVAHTGVNRVSFTGRIAHRALKPGNHQATFSATDAAGTSKPATLKFAIVTR